MIFEYEAPGQAPPRFSVDLRNGLVVFTVRGDPTVRTVSDDIVTGWRQVFVPGQVASIAVPVEQCARLLVELLKVPPGRAAFGRVPYTLWFDNEHYRDEFLKRLQAENPALQEVDRDYPVTKPLEENDDLRPDHAE